MNQELIELQKGCKATCVVILEEEYKKLGQGILMNANISDVSLFARPLENPIFKEQLEKLSSNGKLTYFIIKGISEQEEAIQKKYIGLVKDREFGGYFLPENVIIVFTVKNKEEIKKIIPSLYHFCVVAI